MRVRSRRAVAGLAAACWIAVIIFCIAGLVNGSGLTSNMNRFFSVMLTAAAVLTITAVIGYVITPLAAGHVIGVRAAMRAARDGKPQGRHAGPVKDDNPEGRLLQFRARQ
jgi:hypothetical protein